MEFVNEHRSVLVAEDNLDLAKGISILLRLAGFQVETVYNGVDAVDSALAHHPDIALLDIGLPGLNGYEVAERLRRDGRPTPILIAITAYDRDMVEGPLQPAMFDHYFVKPVCFDTLMPVLCQAN